MIAIVAMARNRVIGRDGTIPWHLPADLKFFKRTTMGHVIVMGRKTFESIGRPLPGRENVVITRGAIAVPGITVLHRPEDVAEPTDGRQTFVIGGAQIYSALLPRCSEILLTLVKRDADGDVRFPAFEADFSPAETLAEDDEMVIRRYVRVTSSAGT